MVLRNTLIDARFTITPEFCGDPKARWILRFCGDWVKDYATKGEASEARILAIAKRQSEMSA